MLLDTSSNQDVGGRKKHDAGCGSSLVTLVVMSSNQCICSFEMNSHEFERGNVPELI